MLDTTPTPNPRPFRAERRQLFWRDLKDSPPLAREQQRMTC